MKIIINIGIFILNIIFYIMKLLPVKNKITYLSRQGNNVPTDFKLVIKQIKKDNPKYKHIVMAKTLDKGLFNKIGYMFYILKAMYHIATSKAVILDTYCIPISLLKQRESLIVIQMWHALGAFKKFGYSILGQKEGSSLKIAKLMHMHENYTYVLTSSKKTLPYFKEAFHVSEDMMKIYPLPKTDLLYNEDYKKECIIKIHRKYPKLKNTSKKIIVYAPTFRKGDSSLKEAIYDFINEIDFNKYELILKLHPIDKLKIDDKRIIIDNDMSSLEFFFKADIIVTDYSAILYEACLLNKPIYFYSFDYHQYVLNRSFYLDYLNDMPSKISFDATSLYKEIENNTCDLNQLKLFNKDYIKEANISYTKDFTDFLLNILEENNEK